MNPISVSERSTALQIGASAPLGATVGAGGVNFSVFSKRATGIDLLLFDHVDDAKPARTIALDPVTNRTYHYWHVFVPGLKPGQIYGFRAQGPFEPSNGNRFDSSKVLLDPYGRAVMVPPQLQSRGGARKGRQRGDGDEERRRGSDLVRLGG
jgi:isoamylase